MLLTISNSKDSTADYLLPLLAREGLDTVRVNTDTVTDSFSISYHNGIMSLCRDGRAYKASEFTNVWYRRPEKLDLGDSSDEPQIAYTLLEWTSALEAFFAHIPFERWVNHPASNANASSKPEQLSTARSLGLNTPATIVTQDPSKALSFVKTTPGGVVIKPLSFGYVEHADDGPDALIYTSDLAEQALEHIHEVKACPTLLQEKVSKEVDVRITIIDRALSAVALVSKDDEGTQITDIRRNNMSGVVYEPIGVPLDICKQLFALMKHYGLRFGAIDMVISTEGKWYFLEVNPNGQWAWLDIVAGEQIWRLFLEAFKR